jgi:hypothetical protein
MFVYYGQERKQRHFTVTGHGDRNVPSPKPLIRLAFSCVVFVSFEWFLAGIVPSLFPSICCRDRQLKRCLTDNTICMID